MICAWKMMWSRDLNPWAVWSERVVGVVLQWLCIAKSYQLFPQHKFFCFFFTALNHLFLPRKEKVTTHNYGDYWITLQGNLILTFWTPQHKSWWKGSESPSLSSLSIFHSAVNISPCDVIKRRDKTIFTIKITQNEKGNKQFFSRLQTKREKVFLEI